MRTLAWICVCSTSAALVPLEPFGVPRRAAPLGSAGKRKALPYTPLPKIMTSAAINLLQKLPLNLLEKWIIRLDSQIETEEQKAESDRRRQARWDRRREYDDQLRESFGMNPIIFPELIPELIISQLRTIVPIGLNTADRPGESMQKLGFLPNEAELPHKAYQSESPPRAPERQLDPETNQQLSDQPYYQLYRGLLVRMGQREQASALEGVGRLEQLSSAERYHAVKAAYKAFTRLDQEFDRLEQSEPPTGGELQAARSLGMRLGEAYEHWQDMREELHELEGNEEKLRTLKVERARFLLRHGRLDTRARLERAFLDVESS